jgi:hypothetical protein
LWVQPFDHALERAAIVDVNEGIAVVAIEIADEEDVRLLELDVGVALVWAARIGMK